MMQYAYIIAAFNAFFFAVLALQKKPGTTHDNLLVGWLAYLGFFVGAYVISPPDFFHHYPILSSSFISLFLLHGPFLYLYINYLASGSRAFRTNDLWHFFPVVLFNLYLLISLLLPRVSERISLDHVSGHTNPPTIYMLFLLLTAISGPVYIFLSINVLRKHHFAVFDYFSYSEKVDLKWLRTLVAIFGIVWTSLMIITVIHHVFHLFSMAFCTDGLFLSLSVFILLIGYFGLRQEAIFVSGSRDTLSTESRKTEKARHQGPLPDANAAARHLERLQQVMVSEKAYLEAGLTLPQLATMAGISTHELSRLINEHLHKSFFDYVNGFRVEHAKHMIADPDNDKLSLLGIAFESGFNSKTAFNRVFKKLSGETPSEYRSSIR